jgi:hypothetical protein
MCTTKREHKHHQHEEDMRMSSLRKSPSIVLGAVHRHSCTTSAPLSQVTVTLALMIVTD